MAFTLDNLAAELGIDPATLQSKPDAVAKWNGYLSQADTQYREAKQALEQAGRDQAAIDEQITKFGVTEANLAELRAANAAYKAALEEVKSQGLNVNLPNFSPAKADAPDPVKTIDQMMRSNFANMGAAMKIQTRYQAVFNKPYPDDPIKLIDEAIAARMSPEQYAEQKYNFTAESARVQAEQSKAHDAQVGAAAVKKYQEEHPVTAGHRGLTPGLASKYPQVLKPRSAEESRDFRKMSIKDRIASSRSRVQDAIAATAE